MAAADIVALTDKLVVFTYSDSEVGGLSTRLVVVSKVWESKVGAQLITGLDADRNEVRTFRVDRIVGRLREVK